MSTTTELRFGSLRYDPHPDGPGLLTLYTPAGHARQIRLTESELVHIVTSTGEVLGRYLDEKPRARP